MTDSLWDPERLQSVGSILTRYSTHIRPGHRIRLGMEGDTSGCYRSSDGLRGTVREVHRDPNGLVRLKVVADNGGEELELDNRNIDKVWEVDPDDMETFRAAVDEDRLAHEKKASEDDGELKSDADSLTVYRAAVESRFDRMDSQLRDMEEHNRKFQETMMSTVRHLAADLLQTSRGAPLAFASEYADRYDLACGGVEDAANADVFEGTDKSPAKKTETRDPHAITSVEYNASVYQGELKESSELTDDDALSE